MTTMQQTTLDSFTNTPSDDQNHITGHYSVTTGLTDNENARSHSRSTDGTDTTDGNQSDTVGGGSEVSTPAAHQPLTLNMALQQQNGTTTNGDSSAINAFPNFNQADLLNFQNNSLIPHHMFTQFGRYQNHFDQKPDVGALQQQMQMREAKPYKCTQCVKAFANSSYLSQHMRIHLGIKPFGPCNYCGKKFTQLSHLQQHIRTHTGEKPYKCKFTGCDKAFSQLSNLQSHSRCHQTDKPFKCNSCYKCFTDEQALLEHIPKHKESKHLKRLKVHICPFCGKSYTQSTYLQKHMSKHADRSKTSGFVNDVQSEHFDPSLLAWNSMSGMNDNNHDASSFNAISSLDQFAANSMIGSVSGTQSTPYTNQSLQNSAFTQLLNFRNNSRYLSDYQTTKANGERPAGFNMITPLENIQRYNGTTTSVTSASATTATTINTSQSTQQFDPQSIIQNMKNHNSY